ncbi:MAG: hypothetical protein H6Q69_853, partial [Firmicutes bacterium]|nr:hypothetical protein [Bacillota bacterium]
QFHLRLTALRKAIHDDDAVRIIKTIVPTYSAGKSPNPQPISNQTNENKTQNNGYAGGYQTATGLMH